MMKLESSVIFMIGAALAVGCTKRVELERSPFMTPLPEGKRPANAAPAETPAARPADRTEPADPDADAPAEDPTEPVLTDEQLAELKDEDGNPRIRPARNGEGESSTIEDARARAAGDPKSASAQLALARAYHRERIYDLALRHYEQARELDPGNLEIGRDIGRLWVENGAPELGLPYLEEACRLQPRDALAWSFRGIALDMLKRYPEAEDALSRATALDARRWDFANNLGYNLLMQERYADAAREFTRGLTLAPGEPALLNNLGLAVGFQGLPDSAFTVFRQAGSDAQAWNNLGLVHRFHGDTEAAATAFETAGRLDPNSREIAANLIEARRRLSDERALGTLAPTGQGSPPEAAAADAPRAIGPDAAPTAPAPAETTRTAQPARIGARHEAAPSDSSNPRPEGSR
jgi:Flp pilus assembly protein TadD